MARVTHGGMDDELRLLVEELSGELSEAELVAFLDRIGYLGELEAAPDPEVPTDPAERREWGRQSLVHFLRAYFPKYCANEFAEFHYDLSQIALDLVLCRGDYADHFGAALAAPRGHAKSTFISLALVIYCAVYEIKRFVLVISDSDRPQATIISANIRSEIERNPLLREDFGDMRGEAHGYRWQVNDFEIVIPETGWVTRVISRGINARIRGLRQGPYRPDLAIIDDAENDKNVRKLEQREELENVILRAIEPALDPDIGRVFFIGTIMHHDSVLMRFLRANADGKGRYVTRIWRALDERGKVLWPARFSLKMLLQVKAIKPWVFATEYQNDPVDEEARLIRPEWVGWYRASEIERGVRRDGRPLFFYRDEPLEVYAFADLAIGEDEHHDEFAMVVVGRAKEQRKLLLLDIFHGRIDFARQVDVVCQLVERYGVKKTGLEKNGYQRVLQQAVRTRLRAEGNAKAVPVKGRKYDRIKGFSPLVERGAFLMRAATEDEKGEWDELKLTRVHHSQFKAYAQAIYYPNTDHDDIIDAIESAFRMAGGSNFFMADDLGVRRLTRHAGRDADAA